MGQWAQLRSGDSETQVGGSRLECVTERFRLGNQLKRTKSVGPLEQVRHPLLRKARWTLLALGCRVRWVCFPGGICIVFVLVQFSYSSQRRVSLLPLPLFLFLCAPARFIYFQRTDAV